MAKQRAPKQIDTLDDLVPDDRNVNRGTERGQTLIRKSLKDYGAGRSVLADRDGRLIAGNKTVENARAAGIDRVRVVQTDGGELVVVQRTDLTLDDRKARELAIVDNRAGQVSLEWDGPELASIAEDFGIDIGDVGFSPEDFEAIGTPAATGEAADVAETPMPDDVPSRVANGDVWELGDHVLMCGDAADASHVRTLLGACRPALTFADPPYGYEYQSNQRTRSPKFDVIQNDDVVSGGFVQPVLVHTEGWVLICTSWKVIREWMDAVASLGELSNLIVWNKGGGGMGDLEHTLATDHELILAYNRGAGVVGKRIGSVWSVGKDAAGEYVHATQKPVALPAVAIETFTTAGDAVYEPFGGAGPAILACEQMGRRCFAMEISAKYCDVILARWEGQTGKAARRVEQRKA